MRGILLLVVVSYWVQCSHAESFDSISSKLKGYLRFLGQNNKIPEISMVSRYGFARRNGDTLYKVYWYQTDGATCTASWFTSKSGKISAKIKPKCTPLKVEEEEEDKEAAEENEPKEENEAAEEEEEE